MKNISLYIKQFLGSLLLLIFVNSILYSQNEQAKKSKTRIKFEFIKKTDNTKWLKTTLSAKLSKKYRP